MSYPAQLQRRLEAAEPGRFAVINLGIPGSSTYEVRQRLPRAIEQYDPDLLLVWAGVNNRWNIEGRDEARREGAQRWLGWSRLYRLYRVWQADPGRSADPGKEIHRDGKPQHVQRMNRESPEEVTWRVDHGFGTEVVEATRSERRLSLDEAEELGYADYTAIAQLGAEADLPVIFLQYPLDYESFGAANRAIERAARDSGSRVVATSEAVRRVPRNQSKWLWGAHPNRHMYGEIALDLEPVVRAYAQDGSSDEEPAN